MISEVPPKIDWMRLSRQGPALRRRTLDQGSAASGQRELRRSRGASWAAITRQGIISPRRNSPSRGVAPTTTPNQRPRISQPSIRTSTHRAHRGTVATDPCDARSRLRQLGAVALPQVAARQSGPRLGSARSFHQHEHGRRPMTTTAAGPSPAQRQPSREPEWLPMAIVT